MIPCARNCQCTTHWCNCMLWQNPCMYSSARIFCTVVVFMYCSCLEIMDCWCVKCTCHLFFPTQENFFVWHIISLCVLLISHNGRNFNTVRGVWWLWKLSQIGNWIHYSIYPLLLWLCTLHNGLVNLFQTIVCYNNYFGHVQNNNHSFCDRYFCHRIPNWQESHWVNCNCTVVLQADASDKQQNSVKQIN